MGAGHIETEAKKVGEIISVPFDFSNDLAAGETIVSTDAEVSVFSGVDSNPDDILLDPPENDDPIVYQRIRRGVVGTLYLVTVEATTSDDNVLQKSTYIAIESQ